MATDTIQQIERPASRAGTGTPKPEVRYIKLGSGGTWAERSLSHGEIHFGHNNIPHEVAQTGDRGALEAIRVGLGHSQGKAADLTREILDFYGLGPDTI